MNQTFMKERRILPLVLSMSLPMVISMAVNSLYNIVDSFFVAKISEDAMTALSLVFPIQNLVNAVTIGFAIGINAVLFLMIHFPKWMMDGTFFSNFAHLGFISILLLSVLFSVIFVKTKSLLLPIGLHMFWDLLMMMVY